MSTVITRSHIGPWKPTDFAWTVPTIVLLLLLIGAIGVISSFPAPTTIGPDGLLAVP
jgi:hypothetical protein